MAAIHAKTQLTLTLYNVWRYLSVVDITRSAYQQVSLCILLNFS